MTTEPDKALSVREDVRLIVSWAVEEAASAGRGTSTKRRARKLHLIGETTNRISKLMPPSDLSRKLETATGLLRESREHVLCVRDHETVERIDAFLSSS